MIEHKDFKIRILFLILCLFVSGQVRAEEKEIPESQDPNSAYLVILGERAQQKGRTQEAIREFKKALMLDPTNQQAQKRLEELGVTQDNLPASTVDPVKLSRDIKIQEEEINQLIQEKNFLEQELESLKSQNNRLGEEKLKAENEAAALKQESQTPQGTVINVLEDYLEVREKELAGVQQALATKETEINEKDAFIKKQKKYLRALKNELEKAQAQIAKEQENAASK